MTRAQALERRYRRLLALYPRRFREEREQEILTVLMEGAAAGERWLLAARLSGRSYPPFRG
jgi:hypothetical protein